MEGWELITHERNNEESRKKEKGSRERGIERKKQTK
jgi:hypothetical protein